MCVCVCVCGNKKGEEGNWGGGKGVEIDLVSVECRGLCVMIVGRKGWMRLLDCWCMYVKVCANADGNMGPPSQLGRWGLINKQGAVP